MARWWCCVVAAWALSESGEAWLAGERQHAKMLWAQTLKPHVCGGRGGCPVGCPIGTKGPLQRNLGGPRRTCAGGIAREHNSMEHGFSLFAPAVRCPRNNAAVCHAPKEKCLRASESSIPCRSCFHLAELSPGTGAGIVVGHRRIVVDVLKGERRLPAILPSRNVGVRSCRICLWAGCQRVTPSRPPPSLPPVRRYALRKDVDRTNSRGAE